MLAMVAGVNQCRLASPRVIAKTKPLHLGVPIVRHTTTSAQQQQGTPQSSNEPHKERPSPKTNRPRSLARWAHLACRRVKPPPVMPTRLPRPVPLKLPSPPARIPLRSRLIAVDPLASIRRPSIAFVSCHTLYHFGVHFMRASRQMFGIRIFRTTMGSSFRSVDVIVLDEGAAPFDLERYMTASQAKRQRTVVMRQIQWYSRRRLRFNATTAEQSSKSNFRAVSRFLPPSGGPSRHLAEQYQRIARENDQQQPPPSTIHSVDEPKASFPLSPRDHDPTSPTFHSTRKIPDPPTDKLTRRGPRSIKLHRPLYIRIRSEQGIKPLSRKFRMKYWTHIYKNIPTYHSHFASTARDMEVVVTECNAVLAAWKQYMLAENGLGLIRIPGPQQGMYVPKRCVFVPKWVKRRVSGHKYGMIVRFLCEFALEQWPERRLAEMAEREQDRVRELFLVPDVKPVNNPLRGARLWEMEMLFKKWKIDRSVEEWVAKTVAEARMGWKYENGKARDNLDSVWK